MGPKCLAYLMAAYLGGVVIWGSLLMSERKRRVRLLVGVGLSLVVQQAAYLIWKGELAGFWWPLAQFFAVQLLIGVGVERAVGYVTGEANSDGQQIGEEGARVAR